MGSCIVCGGELGFEPRMCCNGDQCGCMGQPIDPPICSEECWDRFEQDREIKAILSDSYSWIKVKRFNEDENFPDWKVAYEQLEKHHREETEFLINKCKELAKRIQDDEKSN